MNIMWLQIASLIYITLLIIVYFSKPKLKNNINKVYRLMMFSNFIGLCIEISCFYTVIYMDKIPIINMIVTKGLLIYYLIWILLFTKYIFIVSFVEKKVKLKKYDNIFIVLYFLVNSIMIIMLPMYYYNDGSYVYSYGMSVNWLVGAYSILMLLWIIILFWNYKELKSKKYIPVWIIIPLAAIVGVIQNQFPYLTMTTALQTFITFIMYFTIENPDLRLIEQLNIARDQADRANQAKSEFLSNMSHEIRTPLNAIVGFSQALQEEDIPDQAKEEVKDIVRASESLLELVNGILDISKIEANKIEIVDTEYSIYEILNDLVALTKARMGSKPLEFKTYFAQDIPQVLYGDPVRVKQIILNLLTNAVKYTKEGEVIFRVSSIHNNEVCRLIISVEDTGIGIKKENIDKLFDKFQRLDLEKNITIEGTGLGMAITKKLIDLMNGRIMVQSVYGKGSKFTVALDQKIIHKVVETKVEEIKPVEDEIMDLSGKKILIVDDNKLNLKVASRLIEKYKCDIETIESGFECIDKIKNQEHFDLILMDDMMPEMGGVETFHKLQEIEGFNTPVIALTANAITGMREKYLSEGFNDYLSKPIDKTELNKVLQIIKS